jgi:hypothetical protein
MDRLAIGLLRVALVVLLLASVLGQLLVPVVASQSATTFPEVGYLVMPYSVAGILVVACAQVALLVVWRLLSMIGSGVIFTRRALRWVDAITACGAVATILNAGVWVHLLTVHGGGPGIVLWLVASLAAGVAFVLLMIVMRGLLQAAIADRSELDGVI